MSNIGDGHTSPTRFTMNPSGVRYLFCFADEVPGLIPHFPLTIKNRYTTAWTMSRRDLEN